MKKTALKRKNGIERLLRKIQQLEQEALLIRQDEREKVINEVRDASHWHRGERCIAVKPLIAIECKLKATVEKEG